MCSTPRSSGSATKVRVLSTGKAHIKSYSQMMRSASNTYERNQKERAKRRERLALEEKQQKKSSKLENSMGIQEDTKADTSREEVTKNILSTDKNSLKQRIGHFMSSIWSKLPSIVTT